jgi:hypothetical protein
MRYFYDFEFLEDGHTIDPISVGVVAEDGREFYAVNRSAYWDRICKHSWLRENVLPHLPMNDDGFSTFLTGSPLDISRPEVKYRNQIADDLLDFFLADGLGTSRRVRELWAWFGSYDHVALCQLWGRMIDLPDGIPMFTHDIKSLAERLGNPKLPAQPKSGLHNSLADARHNKVVFDHLLKLEASQIAEASARVACCPMDQDTALELLDVLRARRSE